LLSTGDCISETKKERRKLSERKRLKEKVKRKKEEGWQEAIV